jgi:hypothetical protein
MLGINWTADFGRPLSTAELRTDEISTQQAVDCFSCIEIFRLHFKQLLWRAKKKYFPAIELWLEQLV